MEAAFFGLHRGKILSLCVWQWYLQRVRAPPTNTTAAFSKWETSEGALEAKKICEWKNVQRLLGII